MSKFNIEKAVEIARFTVEKHKLPSVRAQVMMDLDVSGSAQHLFESGQMQDAFQRVLPIGIIFDDNKEIDVFTFQSGNAIHHVEENATQLNFEKYVDKQILRNPDVPLWGGTDYAPVLKANLEAAGFYKGGFFSGKKLQRYSKSGMPAIIYFFTDGENYDQRATTQLLQDCQDAETQAYFMFVGIGNANFSYIEALGDKFDNTGFVNIRDLSKIKDDTIYDLLLPEELCTWLASSK